MFCLNTLSLFSSLENRNFTVILDRIIVFILKSAKLLYILSLRSRSVLFSKCDESKSNLLYFIDKNQVYTE